MKIAVVVPTIRENSIQRFILEWNKYFSAHNVSLIIVEDNPDKTFDLNLKNNKFSVFHFSWKDIDKDLGKNSWVISRRSSAIKSYGFMKAYHMKADIIISLDDDCYPLERYIKKFNKTNFIKDHLDILFKNNQVEDSWFSTMDMKGNIRPRGLPYKKIKRIVNPDKIILSHGLWANVPDFDATTQLKFKKYPQIQEYLKDGLVPLNEYFPMCGMNLAWKRELTPAMYFMLMGKNSKEISWGYDRFDDIWAGLCVKKICDHLGYRISSGHPVIWHDRASDPYKNLKKEKTGLKVNEYLWEHIDNIELQSNTFVDCYKELARKLPDSSEYVKKLKKAMAAWADLF